VRLTGMGSSESRRRWDSNHADTSVSFGGETPACQSCTSRAQLALRSVCSLGAWTCSRKPQPNGPLLALNLMGLDGRERVLVEVPVAAADLHLRRSEKLCLA